MAVNKFWTEKNGMVGTAHVNRNGEVVDFRPAEVWKIDSTKVTFHCPHTKEVRSFPCKIEVWEFLPDNCESVLAKLIHLDNSSIVLKGEWVVPSWDDPIQKQVLDLKRKLKKDLSLERRRTRLGDQIDRLTSPLKGEARTWAKKFIRSRDSNRERLLRSWLSSSSSSRFWQECSQEFLLDFLKSRL